MLQIIREYGFILSVCFCLGANVGLAAPENPVRLQLNQMQVSLNPASGALTAITNQLTSDTKELRDIPFRLTTTRGEITPRNSRLVRSTADHDSAQFIYSGNDLTIDLNFLADAKEANAVRKLLKITNNGADTVTLFRIVLFDWTVPDHFPPGYPHSYYPGGINEVHFHKSGLWYDHSINLFLRDSHGGLFMGVENPFFEANYRSLRKVYPTRIEVSYRPNWLLAPGETFESDPAFVGVYRQEGIYRPPPDPVFFDGREKMKAEILDWGEIWAMQRYMESIMPPPQSRKYPLGYWGYADPGRLGQISRKKAKGETLTVEEQAMLKHFGGGPFEFDDSEIWYRLTPQTVKFYKQVVDDAASLGHFQIVDIPNMKAGHIGWFPSAEEQQHKPAENLNDGWFESPAYPYWQEVADYAAQKGIAMFTLELAGGGYRKDKPNWKYLLADDKRAGSNCYGFHYYAQWYAAEVDKALATHPIKQFQWDEGWMDSNIGMTGEEAYCYDTTHGHLPGSVRYQQFSNVRDTLRTLHEHHPDVRFVIISGLIPGMPWIMKGLDSGHTGAFEHAGWVDHNAYFLPAYKGHRDDGINWILPLASAEVEPTDRGGWYTMLEDPTKKSEWKRNWDKWVNWTNENLDYLNVRRDLFAGARVPGGLLGTAHFLKDRGYIFLHNPGRESHGGKLPLSTDSGGKPVPELRAQAGKIPLNRWLGLTAGERFRVRQLHPAKRDLGVWAYDHELVIPTQPGDTLLLEVAATSAPLDEKPLDVPDDMSVQNAFLNLDEVTRLLNPGDLWPAGRLPGRENMPEF